MLARPRIGALGLRGRIVGLVLVTTVATLVVAAVTLLGPLESRLRNSALKTLQHELPKGSTGPFASILAPHPADRCKSCIDRCRIWLGQRLPLALGTILVLDFIGA